MRLDILFVHAKSSQSTVYSTVYLKFGLATLQVLVATVLDSAILKQEKTTWEKSCICLFLKNYKMHILSCKNADPLYWSWGHVATGDMSPTVIDFKTFTSLYVSHQLLNWIFVWPHVLYCPHLYTHTTVFSIIMSHQKAILWN